MGLTSNLRKFSSKVIGKLTGNVTIRQITNGTYNTTTGTISESNTDVTIKGLVEDITNAEVNDLIQAFDKKLTIAAKDITFVPTPKDKVLISSVIYQIITVISNEQNNEAYTYQLILRA
jgi:hypothetical protein